MVTRMVTGAANRIDTAAGTGEEVWRDWLASCRLEPAGLAGWSSAVIIAAHPDDEVLGAGGTLAILAASSARIRIVAITDGERSHPDRGPAELARVRIAESAAALRLLGAQSAEVVRLGLPDTGVSGCERELSRRLADLCRGFQVCLAPWEGDAHADHEAAGRAACRAHGHVLRYPVWMWHWAWPGSAGVPWDRAVEVPLPAGIAARKAAAIGAYASQLTPRSPALGPVLPAPFVAHFTRRQEVLFR
jgi:LmbE family N-acetylglucosaminyl deacetylase